MTCCPASFHTCRARLPLGHFGSRRGWPAGRAQRARADARGRRGCLVCSFVRLQLARSNDGFEGCWEGGFGDFRSVAADSSGLYVLTSATVIQSAIAALTLSTILRVSPAPEQVGSLATPRQLFKALHSTPYAGLDESVTPTGEHERTQSNDVRLSLVLSSALSLELPLTVFSMPVYLLQYFAASLPSPPSSPEDQSTASPSVQIVSESATKANEADWEQTSESSTSPPSDGGDDVEESGKVRGRSHSRRRKAGRVKEETGSVPFDQILRGRRKGLHVDVRFLSPLLFPPVLSRWISES